MPDPLRRIGVARDLESVTTVAREADPGDVGMTRDGVERIWREVQELYRSGVHPAITLSLRRKGQIVLDRAIGHARGNGPSDGPDVPKEQATPETPFVIASASKAVTAMVAHLLDERGLIHVDDRVCEYIPEFAAYGKQEITIAHVLSHRAGIARMPRELADVRHVGDNELILRTLCDAEPSSRPGRALAYHAISGGYLIAEIVKRVTGKSIRDVLAGEILDPLEFRWMNYGVAPGDVPQVGLAYATGPPVLPPLAQLVVRALGVPMDRAVELMNDPRMLTAVIPSASVVASAHELSRFYELLRAGGELEGVRIFEARTIRRAISEQTFRQFDATLMLPVRYSLGFMLGAQRLSLYGPDTEHAFGHLGLINIIGWADPARALAGGLITSGKPLLYPELPQVYRLMRQIGREAPKLANREFAFEPAGPVASARS